MIVPDEEGLSRHLLVPHDPMRNEVTCAFDGFCKSYVKVGEVDPLRVGRTSGLRPSQAKRMTQANGANKWGE
jgi:hypothetical protein